METKKPNEIDSVSSSSMKGGEVNTNRTGLIMETKKSYEIVSLSSMKDGGANINRTELIAVSSRLQKIRKYRPIIAFWMFGLCNNFAYVVMLSAAHDILHTDNTASNDTQAIARANYTKNNTTHYTALTTHNATITTHNLTLTIHNATNNSPNISEPEYLVCNTVSTGAILLADILPTLLVKFTFPFVLQQIPYSIKISLTALFGAISFILVALSHTLWLAVLGVVSASIGAGLGEITFLSLTTFYHRNVVSGWSSGTGGAGIAGALVYAAFTSLGLSPRDSLLIMLIVPVLMLFIYFIVLPPATTNDIVDQDVTEQEKNRFAENVTQSDDSEDTKKLTFQEKLRLIPYLFKYMVPLSVVYFAEYFINQGLHELLYFNHEVFSRKEQYRWFQVDYQVGVFISRSSVNLVQIQRLWVLPILQLANLALLILQVFYRFIPSFWIIVVIVLWEGLLGGAAYVNTFYRMTNELPSRVKEFCIGIATLGDSIGIAIAGAAAIPSHNRICDMKLTL